jgi:hypothetical protein
VIEFIEKKRFFGKRGQQYIAPVPYVIIDPCGSTLVGPNENELRFQIFSSILDIEFRTGDQGNRHTSTAYLTVDAFLFQLCHARPGRLLPLLEAENRKVQMALTLITDITVPAKLAHSVFRSREAARPN